MIKTIWSLSNDIYIQSIYHAIVWSISFYPPHMTHILLAISYDPYHLVISYDLCHIIHIIWSLSYYPNQVSHIIRPISYDPLYLIPVIWAISCYHMIHTISSISYDPCHMLHIILPRSYDPYRIVHIMWSISDGMDYLVRIMSSTSFVSYRKSISYDPYNDYTGIP